MGRIKSFEAKSFGIWIMASSDDNKAAMLSGYTFLLGSLLMLIHSAMGVNQYKQWLSIHDEPTTSLPFDIYMECFVGLGIAIFAINFLISRPFKEIINTSEAELKRMDGWTHSEDFAIFKRRRHPIPLKES